MKFNITKREAESILVALQSQKQPNQSLISLFEAAIAAVSLGEIFTVSVN